jgi:pyroglutamyl-peptidase
LTSFDTEDVLRRWRSTLGYQDPSTIIEDGKAPDVRISYDAGNFMYAFIYYNSLAHYYSMKKDERPVVFLHVPDLTNSDEDLETGSQVTVALIKALVESRRKVGVVTDSGESQVTGEMGSAATDVNFA